MKNSVVKVPVVMQMEALECGAAALSMILAHFGRWVPLEQLREDCAVSRDGSSAKNILKAARRYGLISKGYRKSVEYLKQVDFPCVIHWNFMHFVVLCGFKKDKAVINDPQRGNILVTMEQLRKSYTGVCLTFEKGEDFQPGGRQKSMWSFAAKRLKGTKSVFLFVFLTGILTTLLGISFSVFQKFFLDKLLTRENPEWIYPFLIAIGVVTFVYMLVLIIKGIYILKIDGKMAITSNMSFMWHVLRLPMRFFSQRSAGDLIQRQVSNEVISYTLIRELLPLVLNFLMLFFYFVLMLQYSVLLCSIGVISVLISISTVQFISKKRINLSRTLARDRGKLWGATVFGIQMVETIKAGGTEEQYFAQWAGFQAAVNTAKVKYSKVNQYFGAVPLLLQSLTSALVLILGCSLIMNGAFTIGGLLAFQGIMNAFLEPVQLILNAGQNVQDMGTLMERVDDVMSYPVDPGLEKEEPIPFIQKLTGELELKNVTFGYSQFSEPVIKDISLKIEKGKRVAFTGKSGCGKSTLAKLISGLYEPWSGEILFDGKPIRDINRKVLTASISVVDQEIVMFEETFKNNIRMWDESISDSDVVSAAKDAQIHEEILQRKEGYLAKVLEAGRNLSGGQRQRLELARALCKRPSVLILDEATSALDAKTEKEVIEAVKKRDMTNIIIAHRLSTIRGCDQIVVLDNGSMVNQGTHEELYQTESIYRELIANM